MFSFDLKSGFITWVFSISIANIWHSPGILAGIKLDQIFNLLFPVRAPFIFTKLFKPLQTFWRSQGISIAMFFDGGVGTGSPFKSTKSNSDFAHVGSLRP